MSSGRRIRQRGPVLRRRTWPSWLLAAGWATIGASVVVAAIELISTGWAPVIDSAVVAMMTVDSASLDPPLVGMPTSLGLEDGAPLSHAGPLGFWLLAIPTKVLGEPGHGLIVGAAFLSLASLAGIAVLLRRRRNLAVEVLGLVLVASMTVSVDPQKFVSPFNPYVGILPLLLCMVAVWGVLAGQHGELWVMVLAGSVAAQTHLGYVPLVAALVALTAVGLAVDVARSSGLRGTRLTRRTIPTGVAVGLVAWIGPIIDQLFGTQNLTRLLTSQSDQQAAGLDHGIDVAVEMTSIPPRWLIDKARDQDLSDPAALRVALSVATAAFVVALVVWAIRRRDRALASLGVLSVVCVVAATLSSARVVSPETSHFFNAETAALYRLFWWPTAAIFALAVLSGLARIASTITTGSTAANGLRRGSAALVPAAIVLTVLIVGVGYTPAPEGLEFYYSQQYPNADAIAALPGDTVAMRLHPEGSEPPEADRGDRPPDVWDLGQDQRYAYTANLVAQLRLRGVTVRFAEEPDDGITFMRAYRNQHPAQGDEPVDLLFLVGEAVPENPPPGHELLSSTGPEPGEPFGAFGAPTAVYVRS